MDYEKRVADERSRPDRRGAATLYGGPGWRTRGASVAIANPASDGKIWWQLDNPNITMNKHPYPLPG